MSNDTRSGAGVVGTLRAVDGKGVVRMEGAYDTDIEDLWTALTDPRRLSRWIADVEGDLRLGGVFRARSPAVGRVRAVWTSASPRRDWWSP
jgi:uncharacterized protein YndB with AHSA1/START domain